MCFGSPLSAPPPVFFFPSAVLPRSDSSERSLKVYEVSKTAFTRTNAVWSVRSSYLALGSGRLALLSGLLPHRPLLYCLCRQLDIGRIRYSFIRAQHKTTQQHSILGLSWALPRSFSRLLTIYSQIPQPFDFLHAHIIPSNTSPINLLPHTDSR